MKACLYCARPADMDYPLCDPCSDNGARAGWNINQELISVCEEAAQFCDDWCTGGFDKFTDQVLPAIQERVVNDHPELIYAICTDEKGYVPTHNNKFAKAPTGNYEVDLINSRSKRIFNDRTGSRCGAHTKKMLLQTYKRETGEIMHDLSVPIYVQGRHWGGFRVGYRTE